MGRGGGAHWQSGRMTWIIGGLAVFATAVCVTNATVPQGNAGAEPVDVLLVLGVPANLDGTPTRMQAWRVAEAVREYRAGVAPRLLFSGGAAANAYVEADVMATLATHLGVPADAVYRERQSRTTLENVHDSQAILNANGWKRVEVISSAEHLRRASVLLAQTPLRWRVHAAPNPGRRWYARAYAATREALGTAVLRWFGNGAEPFLHGVARAMQRAIDRVRGAA